MNNYCNNDTIRYNTYKKKINIIENWFLNCKYNPYYEYCRNRVNKEYDELYTLDNK